MENMQTNFFKSKDFIDDIKQIKKEKGIDIDNLEKIENQNDLNLGLYGWYSICPSNELN